MTCCIENKDYAIKKENPEPENRTGLLKAMLRLKFTLSQTFLSCLQFSENKRLWIVRTHPRAQSHC